MKKCRSAAGSSQLRTSKRAKSLIDAMLKEMQLGLKYPERLQSEAWITLFGAKQSMVVNLQKLVQALGALPTDTARELSSTSENQEVALSREEMALLTQWLNDSTSECR
jgi:hypothetical protein